MSFAPKINPDPSVQSVLSGAGPKDIVSVLLDLESSGALVSISIVGLPGSYLSIVLRTDIHKGTLLFDGLQSHHMDQLVTAGSTVTVRAKLGLNNIAFDCIVDAPFRLNRASTFSAHFPLLLRISEQRNAYRVRIPETMPQFIIQLNTDNDCHEGRLLDISRHGAGALLPIEINSAISSQVSCSFHLLDAEFETRADIRSSLELNKHQRLGLLFADLTAIEHKRLDFTIAALERLVLRDHARLLAR